MAYVDNETGLVEPSFIKMYVDDLARLKELSKTERNVLDILMTKVRYNNEIILDSRDREQICEYANTSRKNLTNVLGKLVRYDIIKKTNNIGIFIMNPDLAYKGKQGSRARLIIEYNELGRTIRIEDVDQN